MEWLDRQVGFLSSWGDDVGRIDPDVCHEYGPHTALKLAALNHSIGVFAPIARRNVERGFYGKSVYIDLFAGCGATRVRGTDDLVAGSPILAAKAKVPFDQIICVEKDRRFRETLERRLASIGAPNATVLPGDCNAALPEIIKLVGDGRPIVFATVDPEGMEILWKTMEGLSATWGAVDLFVNLTVGVERAYAEATKRGQSTHSVEGMMGLRLEEILLTPGGELSDQYEDRVQHVLGRTEGKGTLIRDDGGTPRYRVLTYARRTVGGSPWVDAYGQMHERLGQLTAQNAVGALNTLKGRGLDGRW